MRFLLLFLIIFTSLSAIDELELNFFIEPLFEDIEEKKIGTKIFKNTKNDTIPYYNFFAGKILKNSHNDSILINILNSFDCDYCIPVDYSFKPVNKELNFKFIASNIKNKDKNLISKEIIITDSMKIGIFAVYTPDFVVNNSLSEDAEFNHNVFNVVKKISYELQKKTDFVILLSNLSKYIDDDFTKNLPIDIVISFDYQAKKNEFLSNNRTHWFSIKSYAQQFGRLHLTYHSGKISYKWQKIKLD